MGKIKNIVFDTKEKIRRIDYSRLHDAGIGFWALLILIFLFVILFFVYIKQSISIFVSDYGYIAIFIVSFITDLLVQPIGPDLPLVLGIFGGLNIWIVFIMVLLGAYLALFVSYKLGKTLGAAGIERIIGKKNFSKLSKYETGSKWFMFIGALTPVPYIPYLAGLWRFSFIDTIIFVVIPRTLRFLIVLMLAYYLGITFL
ncbi:MAG: VTT domain-containing protein [Candidatus Woesearchaeota archaeon]